MSDYNILAPYFQTYSWHFQDMLIICSWLVHNFSQFFVHLSASSSWFVHNWLTTSSWLAHNLFITCSGFVNIFDNWFSTCSWLFHDLFMTRSPLFAIFSPLVHWNYFTWKYFFKITSVRYHFPVNYFSCHYFTCNYFSCNYLTFQIVQVVYISQSQSKLYN